MKNKNIIQHFEFNDFDHFSQMIKQGKLEQDQLDKGNFKGSLSRIAHGPIIISRHRMNRTMRQHGGGNKDNIIFIIPGDMQQKIYWRGHDMKGNCIGILKYGMEHESVTLSNFLGFSVSISKSYLTELSVLLGYPYFDKIAENYEVLTIAKNYSIEMQKMLTNIFHSKIFIESLLIYDLPKLIIASISNRDNQFRIDSEKPRNRIFKKAQSFIDYNIYEKINNLNLCKELDTSERNLRYVFNDKIGIGPKKYINNLKLNKIRKELKMKKNIPINTVINEYGFWHSGKFAMDYKMLFGELPSETIK